MVVNESDGPTGFAMAGGDAPLSYTKNSSYQRGMTDAAKLLIQEAVAEKLSIHDFSNNTFRIADLGCSTGPNTFLAEQNIVDAVELKYQSQELEFQVFFNDHVSNDFNTLYRSLPTDRQYYASGVAGSFQSRLFPGAFLHFVHSSYSLHWISELPEEIMDRNSPAWNKGRIYYAKAGKVVIEADSYQYAREIDRFLHARAQEIVPSGLVAIIVPARPDGVPHYQVHLNVLFDLMGSCLVELAKKGRIDEQEVDSFNLPIYIVSPQELKAVVEKNGCFTLERTENLPTGVTLLNKSSIVHEVSLHI